MRRISGILILLTVILYIYVSCAPKETITGAGGGINITLTANPTSIPADGTSTSTITATVKDNKNQAISNREVSFTVDPPGNATLSAPTATTDTNGNASVTLTSSTTVSTVTVTATVDSTSKSVTVDLYNPSQGGPPASITAVANPSSISQNGTSAITATVLDANNNPVADGTVVNFSTSFPGATVTPTATTTNGNASATFTAGSQSGIATVNITADSVSGSVQVTILSAAVGSVQFVSADPTVIAVQGSGGVETSTITFLVKDELGNPVADGTSVSFSLLGPGGGESLNPSSVSTVDGNAVTILRSGTKAGPVTVIATVTNPNPPPPTISAASSNVSIGGGVPNYTHLSVARDILNLPGLYCYGEKGKVTAFVADRFGNPVPENTTVSFFTEAGAIVTSGLTNQYGQAVADIITQGPAPRNVKPSPYYEYEISDAFGNPQPERFWDDDLFTPKIVRNPGDGLLTIIVMTLGEEGYEDANGNGVYDTGENFIDISEPFLDTNDSWNRNVAETYTDSDGNGRYDPPERFLDAGVDQVFDPYEADGIGTQAKGPDGGYGFALVDDNLNGVIDDVNEYRWPGSDDVVDPSGDNGITEGNGIYNAGEYFIDENANGGRDAGEPFVDTNGDGIWNDAEPFWDANVSGNTPGVFDPPNGIWDSNTLIWRTIKILFTSGPAFYNIQPRTFAIPDGGGQYFKITVADINMNPLNDTASLKVTTDNGKLAGDPNWDFPSTMHLGWTEFWVYLYDDNPGDTDPAEAANLKVELNYQLGSCGSFIAVTGAEGTID